MEEYPCDCGYCSCMEPGSYAADHAIGENDTGTDERVAQLQLLVNDLYATMDADEDYITEMLASMSVTWQNAFWALAGDVAIDDDNFAPVFERFSETAMNLNMSDDEVAVFVHDAILIGLRILELV